MRDGRPGRFSTTKAASFISKLHERLEHVIVENLPYLEILRRYDHPNTLFYLDPPCPIGEMRMIMEKNCFAVKILKSWQKPWGG